MGFLLHAVSDLSHVKNMERADLANLILSNVASSY